MARHPLRVAILEAERVLAAAGVASPRVDAELLAAHVVGVPRGRLMMVPLVDEPVLERYRALVARRAAREPLQHLLGTAVLGPVTRRRRSGGVHAAPGDRAAAGVGAQGDRRRPVAAGRRPVHGVGGARAGRRGGRPDAAVHAVEADPGALSWAARNVADHAAAGGTPVALHAADVRWPDLLPELETRVDLVLCNPPYVPDGTPVPPEVAGFDPPGAVFGGPDGLEIIRAVVTASAALLRHGGRLAIEHDDTHAEAVPALLRRRRVLTDVEEHPDLAGRPRFATARRADPR